MKSLKTINDPEAFKLLADESRRKIVFLLRVKEMTVSQIAAELNVTPQAIYHHIKKLLEAEMVEVAREERVDHLIESYYRATAESFICNIGKTPLNTKFAKEQMTTIFSALPKLGFVIDPDDEKMSRLIELQGELDKCCESSKFEDKITELEDVDFVTKQDILWYTGILSMTNEEFEKKQEVERKFRDLLISLVKK